MMLSRNQLPCIPSPRIFYNAKTMTPQVITTQTFTMTMLLPRMPLQRKGMCVKGILIVKVLKVSESTLPYLTP